MTQCGGGIGDYSGQGWMNRHTPYCPLSRPVFERGMPRDYDPNEFPYQCTCHAEGRDS